MSLADTIAAEEANKPGPRCTVARFLEAMPGEDRDDFIAALAGAIQSAALARALRRHYDGAGIVPPNELALARHRRHVCSC